MNEQQDNNATFARISGLTEDHQRLAPFVGVFDAEVRFFMGAGDPVISTGAMRNELVLGGRFVQQQFQGDPPPGAGPEITPFAGVGLLGYNTVDKRYEAAWADNASTVLQVESGQVDDSGREWSFYSRLTNPQTGGPMEKRTILMIDDDDHHRAEYWFREPEGPEIKAMEIHYSRRSEQ
ncbi:MAG: hypothetical protein Tsb002_25440 [Wenzhouxiangellaceae bacterium]